MLFCQRNVTYLLDAAPSYLLPIPHPFYLSSKTSNKYAYRSLTKKDPRYFVLRQGRGRIFVTSLHFTTTLSQPTTGYCTPTHPPSTSLIHMSASLKHVWLHISGQAAAF